MTLRFARHSAHAIRVTRQGDPTEHVIGLDELRRQRASIEKQAARDAARYAAELAEVDEMIEACQVMGVQPKPRATPPARDGDLIADVIVPPPTPSRAKRVWAFLTRPWGLGRYQ